MHDPVRNLFFRLDWLTFECLSHWSLADSAAILAAIETESTLHVGPEELQAVHAFLEHRLPYLGIVDTVKAVLDQMDAELRGNPLFTDVEEMNQLELEARRRADDLINKQ